MNTNTFEELQLMEPILRAVGEQGYEIPTPIQAQAIPHLMKGRDLLGIAQTGTGKTAAFALPILDFLAADPQRPVPRQPSVLVLTPTRELASQIAESFRVYGRHLGVRHAVVFGGVGQAPQVRALRSGVDILVATPGRLIDLMEQRHVDLRAIDVFVLDEADRMLDMGFIHAVRRVIAKLPRDRQSLLFSATMPADIVKLANSILEDPLRLEVTPSATTVEQVAQSVLLVEKNDKRELLGEVLRDPSLERVLVFTRTKHGADRVVRHLRHGGQKAEAIHGDKAQKARERALDSFRAGRIRVLVATDIAARGIDVRDVTHVINFDLPNVPENYVHRIGRTARAGREGTAMSFCDTEERAYLRDIERVIRHKLPIVPNHPFRSKTHFERGATKPTSKPKPRTGKRSPHNRRRRGHRRGRPAIARSA
ncbi:MAG: DEAD/DEAH box helicase [Planctomycetota bacterium]|jgi:ATP-dependent RNA helicase RhlE